MKKISTIFFWGFVISFLGSLPPGAINIAAEQISLQQGKQAAMIYAIGSMLAEVIIVRLTLSGVKQIIRHLRLFYLLELCTALILLALSAGCFIAAINMTGISNILPGYYLPPFKTGVLLSAFNPLHIPFWLGWTSLLMNRNVLSPNGKQYNWYVAGIGIGTMIGFITFIYTAEYLISSFQNNQFVICMLLGITVLIIFLLHIRRMLLLPIADRFAKINGQVM